MAALEYSEKYARMGLFSNKVHNCKICPFFSTSLFRMVTHVRTHRSPLTHFSCEKSNIEVYLCKDCNFETNLTLPMKIHIKKHHSPQLQKASNSQEQNKIRSYICRQCSFETHFVLKWLQHAQGCSNIQWHWCEQCPFKSISYSGLNSHIQEHHLKTADKTGFVCHKCDHCEFKTISLDLLNSHVSEKHTIKCDHCSFRTTQTHSLIRHSMTLHRQLKCNQCSYKSEGRFKLKQHMLEHHLFEKNMSYKCGLCDFSSSAHDLGRHILERHAKAGMR